MLLGVAEDGSSDTMLIRFSSFNSCGISDVEAAISADFWSSSSAVEWGKSIG